MSKLKDLTGKTFNRLTVLKRAENDSSGRARWLCKCECGNQTTVASYSLTGNGTKSCGCIPCGGHNKIDVTGTRFGRLTAYSFDATISGQTFWVCKCDCGSTVSVNLSKLRNKETRSCGCLRAEVSADRMRTHGKARTGTYRSWEAMKQRCTNPNYSEFYLYGGRGIKVCERWLQFESFLADMGVRPEGKSIDRIDVNGDYTKDNCRWATATEQARNKRNHAGTSS